MRPPKYKTPAEMQAKIDEYFKSCEGTPLLDNNGNQVLNKHGEPVYLNRRPPTVTGLALALGFNSRQALLNYQAKQRFDDTITRAKARIEAYTYQAKQRFDDTITRAKARIEAYTEERLFDRDGVMGAKFSLTNNFKGWREHQDSTASEEALQKLDSILNGISEAMK